MAAGALDPSHFVQGTAATTPGTGQFVWNDVAKTLSWDEDGSGGQAAIAIATLMGTVTLGDSDFVVL